MLIVWKFIRGWFRTKTGLTRKIAELQHEVYEAKQDATIWKEKYRNAKEYIEEMQDEIHAYD